MGNFDRVLFLDFDGVLNHHRILPSNYCGIEPECVEQLNRIIDGVPGLKIVISSAWRYMIHSGDMKLRGFISLMLVSGIKCMHKVIGITEMDEIIPTREEQIRAWVTANDVKKFVVLDDLELDMPELVRTNSRAGLTPREADEVIRRFIDGGEPRS